MRYLPAAFVLSVSAVCAACSGGTPVSPSSTTTSASTSLSLSTDPTIGFDHLSGLPCDRYVKGGVLPGATFPDGQPVTIAIRQPFPPSPSCVLHSYTESGVTVRATSGEWSVITDYGHPAPFIEIYVPCTQQAGTCATPATPGIGTIQVTAAGATFSFKSIDLYASLVPIPYQIAGLRNSTTVFTISNTLPNTFGNFATVVNPQAAAVIDTLVISLTDAVSAMGLDNIVLAPVPQ